MRAMQSSPARSHGNLNAEAPTAQTVEFPAPARDPNRVHATGLEVSCVGRNSIGNHIRKSHRGVALISRVIEVANANAPRRADAPIPDASSCLPLQRGGSAGPWPSTSVAEIGKATPHPHARSSCHVSIVTAVPESSYVTFVHNSHSIHLPGTRARSEHHHRNPERSLPPSSHKERYP